MHLNLRENVVEQKWWQKILNQQWKCDI
jgi:hypothetical protein